MSHQNTRQEHDFLGTEEISNDNYYGVQTLRAIQNFEITGITVNSLPTMISAFAQVKKAAALANKDSDVLGPEIADAICRACDEIIAGKYNDQFPTDLIQGGAGTSVNMNVNEVIANIALGHLGHEKGEYDIVHPNNHVNCSQSTNDTYPTALRLALHFKVREFIEAMESLQKAFAKKGDEFKDVMKMGRTQLQDAVPMSLGDEFNAFATNVDEDIHRLRECLQLVKEINMGGTAIGTKINIPEGYPERCLHYLNQETGLDLELAKDFVEASSDTGAYVQVMGTLKRSAVKISKICNDLRLLSSGPRAGLNEINLPKRQPGSSIMPGKINPVIPEVVNQTCYYVIGQDATVHMAAEAGQLQLNVMEPVIAFAMFTSLEYFKNSIHTLVDKCITGITANSEHSANMVMNSVGIITQLSPILGYETCSNVAGEALEDHKNIHEIVVKERGLLSQEKWDEIFSTENLIRPKLIR